MKRNNPIVPQKDIRHIRAAEGWLALGNAVEAHSELEAVSAEYQTHPDFLLLRLAVFQDRNVWKKILSLAEMLTGLLPKTLNCWLLRSEALHELGRTKEAYEVLNCAANAFEGNHHISYELARYAACLGLKNEARSWLELAFSQGGEADRLKLMALEDPALNEVWAERSPE